MQFWIFILFSIEIVDANFQSRISGSSRNHELESGIKQEYSINRIRTSFRSKCDSPCQLESFWIPFEKVLELSKIPIFMHSFLKSKSGGLINVGKCSGHCSSSVKRLYPDLVRQKMAQE